MPTPGQHDYVKIADLRGAANHKNAATSQIPSEDVIHGDKHHPNALHEPAQETQVLLARPAQKTQTQTEGGIAEALTRSYSY